MKARYVFPVVFEYDADVGYGVSVPDLHAYSDGRTFEEAVANAKDAIAAVLYDTHKRGVEVPAPSPITEIELAENERLCAVEVDMIRYADALKQRSVNRTLLARFNDEAKKSGINISQPLQTALVQTLALQE
ncbi:MAG: type II toxin-antitoxin system HicB family antitoxin [Thermoguttaceae bacterium]|nr:type II toxin-antitoxin system HicB family antitoxin [Thermoguttaceae bacterium]